MTPTPRRAAHLPRSFSIRATAITPRCAACGAHAYASHRALVPPALRRRLLPRIARTSILTTRVPQPQTAYRWISNRNVVIDSVGGNDNE